MTTQHTLTLCLFCYGLATANATAQPLKAKLPPSPTQVYELIDQLAHPLYTQREAATAQLKQFGIEVAPQLQAALQSDNAERVARAESLLALLQREADEAPFLQPTQLKFSTKSTTLVGFISAIERQTGTQFRIHAKQELLSELMLPQAETLTYWQAVDQICQEFDLVVDRVNATQVVSNPLTYRGGFNRYEEVDYDTIGILELRAKREDEPQRLTTTVGPIRIEARPVSESIASDHAENRLVTDLRILPEPHFRFGGVANTSITEAKSQWGYAVRAAHDHEVIEEVPQNRLRINRRIRTDVLAKPPSFEALLAFQKPQKMQDPTDKLDLRGKIQAKVWAEANTVAALKNIAPDKDAKTIGSAETKFYAAVAPISPTNPTALVVTVRTDWNPRLIGFQKVTDPDAVWIVNDGDKAQVERAEAVVDKPKPKPKPDSYGVLFLDAQGEALVASLQSSGVRNYRDENYTWWIQHNLVYTVRAANGQPLKQLTQVIFAAHELKDFTIPFALKAAPAAVGTKLIDVD